MNTENIMHTLQARYGMEKGMQTFMTVMPGILADFRKMLTDAAPGRPVMEEYKLEDGKAVIIMRGRKLSSGQLEMDAEIR